MSLKYVEQEAENHTVLQELLVFRSSGIPTLPHSNMVSRAHVKDTFFPSKNLIEPNACFQHKLKMCNDILNDSDIGLPNVFGDGSMIELLLTIKIVENITDSTW